MAKSDRNSVTSVTLLARIQDVGDNSAWVDFVDRYAPQIFSWCQRFRLQDSDSADVTQEVLCKLVQKMRSFQYDPARGRFRGWLKTVTSNTVRDFVASRKRRAQAIGGDDGPSWLDQLQDEKATNELVDRIEAAYQSELLEMAERTIELRVQPHTWQAYRLAACEQVGAIDVARQLEISVSDVYVAKSRVIKLLRQEVARLQSLARDASP